MPFKEEFFFAEETYDVKSVEIFDTFVDGKSKKKILF